MKKFFVTCLICIFAVVLSFTTLFAQKIPDSVSCSTDIKVTSCKEDVCSAEITTGVSYSGGDGFIVYIKWELKDSNGKLIFPVIESSKEIAKPNKILVFKHKILSNRDVILSISLDKSVTKVLGYIPLNAPKLHI